MKLCSTPGCDRHLFAKGICNRCYCRTPEYRAKRAAQAKSEASRALRALRLNKPEYKADAAARWAKYQNTQEYKDGQAERRKTPEYKAWHKAWEAARYQRAEYRLSKAESNRSPERKAYAAAYAKRPERKIVKAAYDRSELGLAARTKYEASALGKSAICAKNARRRVVTANAGSFAPAEERELRERYGTRCPCCGEARRLTLDHVVPLSKGGTNTIDNLQLLCTPCNSTKGNRHSTRYPPRSE